MENTHSIWTFIKHHYFHIVLLNILVSGTIALAIIPTYGLALIALWPLHVGLARLLLRLFRQKPFTINRLLTHVYTKKTVLRNVVTMLIVKGLPLLVGVLMIRYYLLANYHLLDGTHFFTNPWTLLGFIYQYGILTAFPSILVASALSFIPYGLADNNERTCDIIKTSLRQALPRIPFIVALRLLTFLRHVPLFFLIAIFSLVGGGFAQDGGDFVSATFPALFIWGLGILFLFGPFYHIGMTFIYERANHTQWEESLEAST